MQVIFEKTRTALTLIVAMVIFAGTGLAQEFRATISGVVTDPSGAVVSGASVVVKEANTGTTNQTKTDEAGQYVVPFLLPGTYSITSTMMGFQTVTRKGVTLQSQTACPAAPAACDGSQFINGQYTFPYRTLPQTISTVRADGFNNLDASILKNFNFTEATYLQLRFETFNTLNHPVFAAPNVSSATASNFGYITAVYANSQPRQVQLGARIVF